MTKTLHFILFLLLITTNICAQQKEKRENIKLLKTAYITDALDLTSAEAEKFWPVYNIYSEKIQNLKFSMESGKHRKINSVGGIEQLSEEQAKKLIDESLKTELEISSNKTKMTIELSKILSAKKILKLQKAERDFNRRMLQEYGKRRRMQQGDRKSVV